MRVTTNNQTELVITVFSHLLFAGVAAVGISVLAGTVYAVGSDDTLLTLAMVPAGLVFLFLLFVLGLMSGRARFSRARGTVALRTRHLLSSVRTLYPLEYFRFARVHTLDPKDLAWEVVLVFDKQMLNDRRVFDDDAALAQHVEQSEKAGRAPYEISMLAGSDAIFSYARKQKIADAINGWAGVDPHAAAAQLAES